MLEFILNIDPKTVNYIGYLGSALIAGSFVFSNIRTLRIVNSFGALVFILYGILLNMAMPIIITNSIIFAINVYQLSKALFKQQ